MASPRVPHSRPPVGIRALRQQAATYVRRAADGHRVIITVNNEPVAQLGPVESPAIRSMEELVAIHAVVAPRRRGALSFGEPISVFSGTRLDRLLKEVR